MHHHHHHHCSAKQTSIVMNTGMSLKEGVRTDKSRLNIQYNIITFFIIIKRILGKEPVREGKQIRGLICKVTTVQLHICTNVAGNCINNPPLLYK